jgi:hypothetical protein
MKSTMINYNNSKYFCEFFLLGFRAWDGKCHLGICPFLLGMSGPILLGLFGT